MLNEVYKNYFFWAFVINLLFWSGSVFVITAIKRLPLYHPIWFYHLYHFIGYVMRPYVIWSGGIAKIYHYIGLVPSTGDIAYSIFLTNLALLSVMAGFLVIEGWDKKVPLFQRFDITIKSRAGFHFILVVLIISGLYSTWKAYGGTGLKSVSTIKVHVDEKGGQQLEGTSGYVYALAEFVPAVCLVLYAVPKTRKGSYPLIAAFVLLRVYCGAGRTAFVVVLTAVFLMGLVISRRRFPPIITVFGVLFFALVFNIIGNDRYAFRRIVYGQSSVTEVFDKFLQGRSSDPLTSDTVEFDMLTEVVSLVPEKTGWTYGSQYLRALIWPIPRQVWPDKPVDTSTINLKLYGNFFGLTRGIIADTYTVFGVPSIILILFGMGAGLTKLYRVAIDTRNPVLFMLFWTQLMYQQILMRDGGVTFVYFEGFSMIAIILITKFGGLRLWRAQES